MCYVIACVKVLNHSLREPFVMTTVNQQILAAIKFGISQNIVIWRLLNLASPRGPSLQCTIDVYVGGDKYLRKHAIRQIRQM